LIRRRLSFTADRLRAVNNVSLSIPRAHTLGLVGESGCGKSTLGRTILGLYKPAAGSIHLAGQDLTTLSRRQRRPLRRRMQIVFQDPFASLDPRMTAHEIIAEPLRINRIYTPQKVAELLDWVGLPNDAASRLPAAFSGGQRQRIAIARALALSPDLVILDEAVSALDVSIQAQIINLLRRLQRDLSVAYLFISHDLSIVRQISHSVAVMYLGRIVEQGSRDQIFASPAHPYTQALLSSAGHATDKIILRGDIPNPLRQPTGCVFHTRCFRAQPRCETEIPALIERTGPAHLSACHFVEPR